MAEKTYSPPRDLLNPFIKNLDEYNEMYQSSIEDPQNFFGEQAKENLDWVEPFSSVHNNEFVDSKWFEGGKINIAYNCIDRHLKTHSDKTALIWEGDDPNQSSEINYADLHINVCRFGNILKSLGATKGSRVCIYMPMIPEAAYAMLACARIGAIHSVVFGGFAANELATRIDDCTPKVILAGSCGVEPSGIIAYKPLIDAAIDIATHKPEKCIIYQREILHAELIEGRDLDWVKAQHGINPAECEKMNGSDPAYILYTSGTTGKSKAVALSQGNLYSNASTLKVYWDIQKYDRLIHMLPIFHTHGLFVAINTTLHSGLSVYFFDKFSLTDLITVLPKATLLMGVPTYYKRMNGSSLVTKNLTNNMRLFISGSAPLSSIDHQMFYQKTGHTILERYGMTETNMNTSCLLYTSPSPRD